MFKELRKVINVFPLTVISTFFMLLNIAFSLNISVFLILILITLCFLIDDTIIKRLKEKDLNKPLQREEKNLIGNTAIVLTILIFMFGITAKANADEYAKAYSNLMNDKHQLENDCRDITSLNQFKSCKIKIKNHDQKVNEMIKKFS